MKIVVNKNTQILKKEFNNHLLNSFKSLKNNDRIVIWLSWWNSLKIFYEDFVNIFEGIDWEIREKIYFCFLDERNVPFDNDDSNYKLVKEIFLDELVKSWFIEQWQILLPDFGLNDYELDYFNKVQKIDIWLFWVWPDCHICSLFPNHELLKNKTYSYLKISDSPKPPKDRITISVSMLQDIKYAFVFFMWESKKIAFDLFVDNSINSSDCPVKLVEQCENIIVISDLL